jgi:uncharacterized damage-inducible protein DinB
MARYNTWMNRKLYAIAHELGAEACHRDLGAFFGSVHATLNHLLLADRIWMSRFTGDRERFASRDAAGAAIAVSSLDQILYADLSELTRERAETDAAIEQWTASLTEQKLGATLAYTTSDGTRSEHPLWWAVSHFFNHQTHHRGQVTTLLRQLGRDPGVTDLAVLLRGH